MPEPSLGPVILGRPHHCRCRCPSKSHTIPDVPLMWAPEALEHACPDIECEYGHGLESAMRERVDLLAGDLNLGPVRFGRDWREAMFEDPGEPPAEFRRVLEPPLLGFASGPWPWGEPKTGPAVPPPDMGSHVLGVQDWLRKNGMAAWTRPAPLLEEQVTRARIKRPGWNLGERAGRAVARLLGPLARAIGRRKAHAMPEHRPAKHLTSDRRERLAREAFEAGSDWADHGARGSFVEPPPDFDDWWRDYEHHQERER